MKNLNFKSITMGFVLGAMVSFAVFALAEVVQIEVEYNDVKIKINGQLVDTEGSDPFVLDGRTYVPARYIAEGLGAKVEWNGEENTVMIDSKQNNVVNGVKFPQLKESDYDKNIILWSFDDGEWWYERDAVARTNKSYRVRQSDDEGRGILTKNTTGNTERILEDVPLAVLENGMLAIPEKYFNEVLLPIIKP